MMGNQYEALDRLPTRQNLSEAKTLYQQLLRQRQDETVLSLSLDYLNRQLASVDGQPCDFPKQPAALSSWMTHNATEVSQAYQRYLTERKSGGLRRYFRTASHALYFLRGVAPTKLVDGAWLYGLLSQWKDTRFSPLIRIYLEELGNGKPEKNHVVLYRNLIASNDIDEADYLSDAHYTQGLIQLCLAYHADEFLPEILGFNLGYEQLPLHLLITAYELNELGIDPYYFTLHVTVDNLATGHAQKACKGLMDLLPQAGNTEAFYRRVINGYRLNSQGIGTTSVIASFNLEQEVISILAAKSSAGAGLHSDYCRVAGRSVNEWLSNKQQIPAFLKSLEEIGWIKRHQDPADSRFWKLIEGDKAEMFGVFNAYERQAIHDWILGNAENSHPQGRSYRAKRKMLDAREAGAARVAPTRPREILGRHATPYGEAGDVNDFNSELRALEADLASLSSKEEIMAALIRYMKPSLHATPAGLMATRVFTQMLAL
ncbi:MAG: hypothetical protein K0S28_715 [Paucimonas sp.]|jgi:hypothetical protein|nr:hypothetical protein [Paucimonas sp.]